MTSISKVKSMHILNNNRVKVFKTFKHFSRIMRCNSCQFMVLVLVSLLAHVIGFKYIKRNKFIKCKCFFWNSTTKKNLNFKLFGTCNLGSMIETIIKQLDSNLKQQSQFKNFKWKIRRFTKKGLPCIFARRNSSAF